MSEMLARLMDGCERITWRSWPGAPGLTIGIRPLPDVEWDRVVAEANATVTNGDERERVYMQSRAQRRALIARCVVCRAGDVVGPMLSMDDVNDMDETTALALIKSVRNAQEEAHGVSEWLDQKAVFDEIDRVYDSKKASGLAMRLRARFAGLLGFYGVSDARRLTSWQVVIFARLAREGNDE